MTLFWTQGQVYGVELQMAPNATHPLYRNGTQMVPPMAAPLQHWQERRGGRGHLASLSGHYSHTLNMAHWTAFFAESLNCTG